MDCYIALRGSRGEFRIEGAKKFKVGMLRFVEIDNFSKLDIGAVIFREVGQQHVKVITGGTQMAQ